MGINGKTKFIAIFGWPLTYTRSPVFQNAGLKRAGVDAVYLPMPVQAADFPALWRSMAKLPNFLGANVTNPHKQAALKQADRLTPEAKAIGAVNTLYRRGKSWIGHNTDAAGFSKALNINPKGRHAVIFGAGGTARATTYALLKIGARSITIVCRRPAQGRALLRDLRASPSKSKVCQLNWQSLGETLWNAEILINTIPGVKLAASLGKLLHVRYVAKGLRLVFDASYANKRNPFLKAAPRGCRRVDGLGMLLEQGCLSFECWTGKKAPKAMMRKALGH